MGPPTAPVHDYLTYFAAQYEELKDSHVSFRSKNHGDLTTMSLYTRKLLMRKSVDDHSGVLWFSFL